jgi:hypothetical protein
MRLHLLVLFVALCVTLASADHDHDYDYDDIGYTLSMANAQCRMCARQGMVFCADGNDISYDHEGLCVSQSTCNGYSIKEEDACPNTPAKSFDNCVSCTQDGYSWMSPFGHRDRDPDTLFSGKCVKSSNGEGYEVNWAEDCMDLEAIKWVTTVIAVGGFILGLATVGVLYCCARYVCCKHKWRANNRMNGMPINSVPIATVLSSDNIQQYAAQAQPLNQQYAAAQNQRGPINNSQQGGFHTVTPYTQAL